MSKGTVKFFNDTKGYGFIKEDGSEEEHFVHISGLIDEVREGDVVEFELQQGKKGMNAVNVTVID
ncbi:cold shock domain-containing protein [Zeaxanthinibacter sp. PT1]|uniref:CspA family cold shock protein n=1 Tax=Zeaxanthinibacter enoshimensis TaxID=392009 RepID=A0A4R6TG56_9FLAO|nr:MULTISPECIES: cold shock domain-containing protein [Zeaxanthinibacter]MDC6352491.1 cold shock domain-containing protein [Zeaxanthinibacter sp. PT1]TDQ29197.1 CspA family cold shock protein [Zeaxanthinibacter enoshimensis]